MAERRGRQLGVPRSRRSLVAVAVSILGHVIVLAGLAWPRQPPAPPTPPDQPIYLSIEPRPLLKNETPRPRPIPSRAPEAGRPALGAASALLTPSDRDDNEDDPAPRLAPADAASAAQAQGVDPWQVRPETTGDRVAQALRSGAASCAMLRGRMNAVERANCERRLAQDIENAVPITGSGDRERDARFAQEGARALRLYEYRRAPLAGQSGVVGPADCPGSNFGAGCAGAHQDPGFRQNSQETFDEGMGRRDAE